MTICDVTFAINTPIHQTNFPANFEAGFQVLAFTFWVGILENEDFSKLRLQIKLLLLWRQQLPVVTVNFLQF
jgi:hypothetical protein